MTYDWAANQPSWAFNPSFSFSRTLGNTEKRNMVLDPTTLALGGISSLANLFGGLAQAQTSASIAQANFAAQNQAILEGRQQTKAALGQSIWAPVFGAGTGGDIEFNRQKAAEKFKTGPLAERLGAQEFDIARGKIGLEGSAEARKLRQEANRAELVRSLTEREAGMAGMFGQIAPRQVGTYFV